MEHDNKLNAIKHIRPDAEFSLTGDDLVWLDETQTEPTNKEIEAGLIAYNLAEESKAQTREAAKAKAEGKLAALGLTTDDLRALGL
jgi:hypothetical protein